MKYRVLQITALALVLQLATGVDGFAGGRGRAGTAAAPELLIPVGARDLAMGGSAIATSIGLESIHYNPAGLARASRSTNAIFSHMTYIGDIGVDYIGVSTSFSSIGTFGLTIKTLSFGDIAVTTEDVPDGTGEILNPTFVTAGLTYSRVLTDRISVGVTANIISEQIERVSASGFAVNFGVQYQGLGGVKGLSLGVAVKNLGGAMQFDGSGLLRQAQVQDVSQPTGLYKVEAATAELPSTIEMGMGYSLSFGEDSKANLTGVFQQNNFSDDEVRIGGEYSYKNIFFLRGGYGLAAASDVGDNNIFGMTFGGGFQYDVGGLQLGLDYAFRDVEFLESNHTFALRLGF